MDDDKSLFVVGVLMVLFLASSGLASANCVGGGFCPVD
jgi:hypothetical protein